MTPTGRKASKAAVPAAVTTDDVAVRLVWLDQRIAAAAVTAVTSMMVVFGLRAVTEEVVAFSITVVARAGNGGG